MHWLSSLVAPPLLSPGIVEGDSGKFFEGDALKELDCRIITQAQALLAQTEEIQNAARERARLEDAALQRERLEQLQVGR